MSGAIIITFPIPVSHGFTTLYWDFLDCNYNSLKNNNRMKFQIKNIERLREKQTEIQQIRKQAELIKERWIK